MKQGWATALVALLAGAIVWGGLLLNLQDEYRRADADAAEHNALLARTLADSVANRLDAVAQALTLLREIRRTDPAGFDLAAWTTGLSLSREGIAFVRAAVPDAPSATPGALALARAPPRDGRQWLQAWLADGPDADGAALQAAIPIDLLLAPHGSVDLGPRVAQLSGAGLTASVTEGDRWLEGAAALAGHDLAVHVAMPQRAVQAPLEAQLARRVVGALELSLCLAVAGVLVWRQQRAAAARRRTLELALDSLAHGVALIDRTGRVLVFNRCGRQMLGLPDALLRTEPSAREIIRWQIDRGEFGPRDALPPEVTEALRANTFSAMGKRHERSRPDGTILEIHTHTLPDGAAIRIYADITDRRRTEAALAASRDAAEAAGRARTDFLAVMSHEIRTPMNAVIGVSHLLLDMKLGSTEQHYVRIILESGQGLLRLINDILDFARLDGGRMELEEAAFDIRQLIQDAVGLLRQEARARGLDLLVDVADDVPKQATGDALRLRQVLLNLLGNGIKFTPSGSVRLSVSRVRAEAGHVRLGFAVIDTGIGIEAASLDRLFQEFTQVDSSISRRFGGSGLGLAISRRLVERMGGTIGVESTPGLGTTCRFDIRLGTFPEG